MKGNSTTGSHDADDEHAAEREGEAGVYGAYAGLA